MYKSKFLAKVFTLVFVMVILSQYNASAQSSVYLEVPNSVPSYCQETNIWCGVATTQMILEGYPGGIEHPNTQAYIWSRIVAHRDDAGVSWATDPDGLKETLMEIGGDPGVNWVIHPNANPQSLMYSVAYWMARRQFPVAVLVYGFQHWVMIDGFTSDVDPLTNPTINLQFVEIVDPWNPPCPVASSGGVRSLMTGSNWYTNYWYSPGIYPASKWNGNYIAVIEPPQTEGVAKARMQAVKGKIISEKEARSRADALMKQFQFEKKQKRYEVLRGTISLKPVLINQKNKGYYLVPLGYKDGELCQGAVLLNAYNGEFQEVGTFLKPMKYLSQNQAKIIALNYLCGCKDMKKVIKAELIFKPCVETQSRFLPVWMIKIDKRIVYVTQEGRVIEQLTPSPLGD
jgi:hypothetical protein